MRRIAVPTLALIGLLIAGSWISGTEPKETETGMFKGLRTVGYTVGDLDRAKAWYSELFETEPYFDEPFYVGFTIGGFELGLMPDGPSGEGGVIAYWGVDDAEAALAHALAVGATASSGVQDVGGGIKVAEVRDPWGNRLGIIENPHFRLEDVR